MLVVAIKRCDPLEAMPPGVIESVNQAPTIADVRIVRDDVEVGMVLEHITGPVRTSVVNDQDVPCIAPDGS